MPTAVGTEIISETRVSEPFWTLLTLRSRRALVTSKLSPMRYGTASATSMTSRVLERTSLTTSLRTAGCLNRSAMKTAIAGSTCHAVLTRVCQFA